MNRPVADRFGENLARHRKRAGISQEELGYRASLHRTEVGLIERSERVPRIDTLLKLAGALELPPERLLEGMSWSPGRIAVGAFSVSEGK
jgi:transcriptional regulator with XRE-family HTH domain